MKAIVISDVGKLIVTCSCDRTVRLWDARNGEAIGKPMGHSRQVRELAISTDGSVIVSGDDVNSITRSNTETGEQIGDLIKVAVLPTNLVISYD